MGEADFEEVDRVRPRTLSVESQRWLLSEVAQRLNGGGAPGELGGAAARSGVLARRVCLCVYRCVSVRVERVYMSIVCV